MAFFNMFKKPTGAAARAPSPGGTSFPAAGSPTTEEELGPMLSEVLTNNNTPNNGTMFNPQVAFGGGTPFATGGGLHVGGRPVYGLEGGLGGGLGFHGGLGGGLGGGFGFGGGSYGHQQQLGTPAMAGASDLFGGGGTPNTPGGVLTYGGLQDTEVEGRSQSMLGGNIGLRTPTTGGAMGATQQVGAPPPAAALAEAGTPGGAPPQRAPSVPPEDVPLVLRAIAAADGRFDVEGTEAGVQASGDAATYKANVLAEAYPLIFMYVTGDSQKLRLIHSIALCEQANFSPSSGLGGKCVGFSMKSNTPQVLNQTKWHTWKEVE
eukprot:scaffold23902_cov168-Skeletonema_dohrnii-CCMP3373.AAC.1